MVKKVVLGAIVFLCVVLLGVSIYVTSFVDHQLARREFIISHQHPASSSSSSSSVSSLQKEQNEHERIDIDDEKDATTDAKPSPSHHLRGADQLEQESHQSERKQELVQQQKELEELKQEEERKQQLAQQQKELEELKQEELKQEEEANIPTTALKEYIQSHSGFPIVLLCYNRPAELDSTLESLLSVEGVDPLLVLAVQDGSIETVSSVIQKHGIQRIQRPEVLLPPNEQKDPGFRIAQHYKYGLTRAFDHFPDAPGVVVVEDDFKFSPDFMQFFMAVAPAIDEDDSLWIASAWNDNGFDGNVRDKLALRRTDFFPGLGWLLLRKVWDELKAGWPRGHWDWYLRNPKVTKGRQVVFPEVPRDFHAGAKGSFVDPKTQKRYFDRIAYNQDASFKWPKDIYKTVMKKVYDDRIEAALTSGIHVANGLELFEKKDVETDRPRVIWYVHDPNPRFEAQVKPLAQEFNIWHQLLRGSFDGMHEIYYNGLKVFFINTFKPRPCTTAACKSWFSGYAEQTRWIRLKPHDARVFTPTALMTEIKAAKNPR